MRQINDDFNSYEEIIKQLWQSVKEKSASRFQDALLKDAL